MDGWSPRMFGSSKCSLKWRPEMVDTWKASGSNNGVSKVTVISHTINNIFCGVKREFYGNNGWEWRSMWTFSNSDIIYIYVCITKESPMSCHFIKIPFYSTKVNKLLQWSCHFKKVISPLSRPNHMAQGPICSQGYVHNFVWLMLSVISMGDCSMLHVLDWG